MPFGISPAGEIFQQRLDQAIDDLDGERTVADDILVIGNGETMQEAVADHDRKLKELFDRCRAKHIKLNPNKIELKKTSMPYIGHILTSDGVQADPAKVQAILEMKQPTDVAGVRRILGTVNYLAKFLPHLSQIEKELLAIAYGTERFHQYTYGRLVPVESDHKPLEVIHQKPLSAAPRRLQKMMMRLHQYDPTVVYKKASEMLLADTLSRHHLNNSTDEARSVDSDLDQVDSLEEIKEILNCVTTTIFQDHTTKDQDLQQVKSFIQSGWPGSSKDLSPTITPYFHLRDELTTQEGLVFRGERVVIPKSLRKQVLNELHAAHQEIA
ncbi:Hypothetical predicted protein [Paramuricea clavata]|uniref:Uncharacterized protein n=1 Tax=Paramuricea clavata TaxID=317549 RepID=A0A6S7FP23_PARCT|nr:Hypothetical predicted protein [Paramuricea clavata]